MNTWKRHTLVGVLLCALGLAAYGASLRSGFVWDDNFQIVRNPYLHSDQPLSRLLTSDVWGYIRGGQVGMSNYYRPLQMLTYRLVAAAAGLQPVYFHAASLILNILASFAAYLVAWQLTRRTAVALAAGVLFALHPIHSEAVLWVSASTELGCALFYFLSFWLFLRAEDWRPGEAEPDSPRPRKQRPIRAATEKNKKTPLIFFFSLSCASFFLALLWKEMALTLPVVVAEFAFITSPVEETWWKRGKRAAWKSVPFWIVAIVYAVIRVRVLGYFSTTQHAWPLTAVQFAENIIVLLGEYWLKLLLPLGLNCFHVFHPVRSPFDWRVLAAGAFVAGSIALILASMRRYPLVSFGMAWVFLTLAPVMNLQGVGENIFTERYLYIPSLGFAWLVAWAAAAALRHLPTRAAIASALLIAFSAGSVAQIWRREQDWHDERALYSSAVRLSPDAALMRSSLADVLRNQYDDLDGAEQQYQLALAAATAQQNNAQIGNAYVGLAGIASQRGQYQLGLEYIAKGLALHSDIPGLRVGQGILLLQTNRTEEARAVLQEANRYFPYDEVVLNALGVIAMIDRDYVRAVDCFQQAVQVAPTYADGFNNLGRAYAESNQLPQSISSFERAVALRPKDPQFLTNLGVALARSGRYAEARQQLQRAVQYAPGFPAAVANLQQLDNVQPVAP